MKYNWLTEDQYYDFPLPVTNENDEEEYTAEFKIFRSRVASAISNLGGTCAVTSIHNQWATFSLSPDEYITTARCLVMLCNDLKWITRRVIAKLAETVHSHVSEFVIKVTEGQEVKLSFGIYILASGEVWGWEKKGAGVLGQIGFPERPPSIG